MVPAQEAERLGMVSIYNPQRKGICINIQTYTSVSPKYRNPSFQISKLVPEGQSVTEALRVAASIASGPQHALRHTKRALNVWLQQNAVPAFEVSAALEMLDFQHADVDEGLRALKSKSKPEYPSAKSRL